LHAKTGWIGPDVLPGDVDHEQVVGLCLHLQDRVAPQPNGPCSKQWTLEGTRRPRRCHLCMGVFNEERLHSELGDRTPAEFEEEYGDGSQASAA